MNRITRDIQGYLQLNIPRIKLILIFSLFFFAIFCFFQNKGYTKIYKRRITLMVCGLVLSMNSSFIFVMTLLGRKMYKVREYRVIPFESSYHVFVAGNMELLLQIIMNVAMYIPLGFLLPSCFKLFDKYRYIIFTALVSSMTIELIQAIFKIGLFEIDDIINNVLGAVIGVLIYALFSKLKKSRTGNQKEL